MGRIVISQNTSLDGVVQDPTGEDGFRLGGWFAEIGETDRQAWAKAEYAESLSAEALLLGRRSDEWFATRWLSRTGEWADRLNGMPKYVVSSTIDDARWSNSTVLKGDVVAEIARLKQELDGDIVVYGSCQLARTLIEHDLVDEIRLMVYPVLLGAGERLFDQLSHRQSVRLVDSRIVGDGLAHLTYAVTRSDSRSASGSAAGGVQPAS